MVTFEIRDAELSADKLADELERIALMIRDGFTFGEVNSDGYWTSNTTNGDVINA